MSQMHFDIIVIGGGTMGTAAGWALAKGGHRVVVLEQFDHVHALGSHGGKTRIFRHAYAEGASYVPWTLRADKLWTELQERTGGAFMVRTGCLDIAAPDFHHARSARASAETYDIRHEWLSGDEVNRRWPAWNFPAEWEACFSPDAGFLLVEPALRALATEMTEAGGQLRTNEPVRTWSPGPDGVEVVTDQGTYRADRLIVTAGAWAGKVLHELGLPLEVRRKPVFWFEVEDRERFAPEQFPVFITEDATGEFYGVPMSIDPGVKIGVHTGGESVDPDTVNRQVTEDDIAPAFAEFLETRLRGVSRTLADSAVCMYTMTPDAHFVIDRHPESDRVVFAAGFSGHGFKFAPVVGEYLAQMATDDQVERVETFAVSRFVVASTGL